MGGRAYLQDPGLCASTGILVLAVLALQSVTARFIRRNLQAQDLRRRWLVHSRNGLVLLLVPGLMI